MTAELLYSKDHEWVRVDSDGVAVVGVTDYAAEQLGDVVYVDLPESGADITAGTEMGEIESTKSVSDLFSPLDGTVTEVNQARGSAQRRGLHGLHPVLTGTEAAAPCARSSSPYGPRTHREPRYPRGTSS